MLGELIAARVAVQLVLLAIDPLCLSEDLPRDPLIVIGELLRRVRGKLRPVDRDRPDAHQTRLGAQPQHAPEQTRQCRLMPAAKPRDRRVIRLLIRRDHPISNVLNAPELDPARGLLPLRIRIQQQPHHQPRIERRPPKTVRPIRLIERRQIQLLDRRQQEPRKVIRRQPIRQRRRHQQHLIPVNRNEVPSHPAIVLTRPDRPPLLRQPHRHAGGAHRVRNGCDDAWLSVGVVSSPGAVP